MKFCGECGNKLRNGAKFCGSCGAKVIEVEVTKNTSKPVSNKDNKKKLLIGAAIAVVVIVAAVAVLFAVNMHDQEGTSKIEEESIRIDYSGAYTIDTGYDTTVVLERDNGTNNFTLYYCVNGETRAVIYIEQTVQERGNKDAQFLTENIMMYSGNDIYNYLSDAVFKINRDGLLTIESGNYYECFNKQIV